MTSCSRGVDFLVPFNVFLFAGLLTLITGQDIVDLNPKIVRVHNPSHQFLDEFNRTRWFHGTNVVMKKHPWYPENGGPDECERTPDNYAFCDSDMDYLQELGVNVVRLGVMWAGAEPDVRGTYDDEYFKVVHGIIQRLAGRGIYTLVDVHQDVMGRQVCGEGFPDWFIEKDWVENPLTRFPFPQFLVPFTVNETTGMPDPYSQCEKIGANWFVSYLTVAVGNAFGRLYNNHNNLGDTFANYWGRLAEEYGNYTSVLGYDLLNEPWAGDIYVDPSLLVPGQADRRNLQPLWEKCNSKIRAVDNETLVFFEGVTWDIRDGHTSVPGGDGSKTAMSYHYYAPPQFGLHTTFKNRIADQDRLRTGGMLTEFRMWSGDDAASKEMRETVDLSDTYLQSWMGWEFSSFWSQTNVEIERHYARTYAPAVAGVVQAMGFDEDTAEYFITWTIDTSIKMSTEIKVNRRIYYPNGYWLTIVPSEAATWANVDGQNIQVDYTESAINGQSITVSIVDPLATTTATPPPTAAETTTTEGATNPPSTTFGSASGLKLNSHLKHFTISVTVVLLLLCISLR